MLAHVLSMTIASEVWKALEFMFTSQSRAQIMQVRMQLANTCKEEPMSYRQRSISAGMKALADTMREDELISYILAGMYVDYNPLVASITTRADSITLNYLYAHLLAFEMRLEFQNSGAPLGGFTANMASRGN